MAHHLIVWDLFKQICKNSDHLARRALGLKPNLCFLRPQHICTPMFRSVCEELYGKVEQDIRARITRIRSKENVTQYLFLEYAYLKGKLIDRRLSKKHFSVGVSSIESLTAFIKNPTRKLVCINDVHLPEERYIKLRKALLDAFEERFPQKSKYEI